jgi:TPR repeat protein
MRDAEADFAKGCNLLDKGHDRQAVAFLRRAARKGHDSAQVNLGWCYDEGRGGRRSRRWALLWYRRAASAGSAGAAINIGTVYRDEGRWRLALRWFQQGVALGAPEGFLDLAKLYAGPLKNRSAAKEALTRLLRLRPERVLEDVREEASQMEKRLRKPSGRHEA